MKSTRIKFDSTNSMFHIFLNSRFMTMIAHLILCISVLLSRDANVKACLPFDYSDDDYSRKDTELAAGLSVAIALLFIEYLGFLSGLTMFSSSVALLSIMTHATASVAMGYFALDVWDCNLYWWIFSFCSALPALVEIFVMIGVVGLKRSM